MLFNSPEFLFGYLPVVVLGFFLVAAASPRLASVWLVAASIVFYGWWNAAFVPLLMGSVAVNFLAGTRLARCAACGRPERATLVLAVTFNLALLGYFKYADFFLSNASLTFGLEFHALDIVLPIGISFFTFTQIAFLVDAFHGRAREYDPVHYSLFVSYFPHLVAGPIMHHREMMPQFAQSSTYQPRWENFAVGLTILSIGLFKKVVLADNLAPYAETGFSAAASGKTLTFVEAWVGALAYTFQLYFDFSGYSDMAIGISRLFGIRLPVNFDSPYKALNIADFWRRWHMTLSRFLRDYLYVPLGGNRAGPVRHFANLFLTMVLGGLWHGAGWPFVVWGALHGAYLVIHRAFRSSNAARWLDAAGAPGRAVSLLLTFILVIVAWVFFRAESLDAALVMLRGMSGGEGVVLPESYRGGLGAFGGWLDLAGVGFGSTATHLAPRHFLSLLLLAAGVWILPNTQQIMVKYAPALPIYHDFSTIRPRALNWQPTWGWLAVTVVCGWVAIFGMLSGRESPFLYFRF